jgi:hypothetical protein
MAETENGQGKYSARSGMGWRRLDDGNYLWQRHKRTDAIIISEDTFNAITTLGISERIFALVTVTAIVPMAALLRQGQLSWATFIGIVVCLIVLNIPVGFCSRRRMRALTQEAKPSGQRLRISYNPLRVFSDGMVKGMILFSFVWGAAALFALAGVIPGTRLPQPAIHPVVLLFLIAVSGLLLKASFDERTRRRQNVDNS